MSRLILLCGIPGVGKSFLAKQLRESISKESTIILQFDKLFPEWSYPLLPTNLFTLSDLTLTDQKESFSSHSDSCNSLSITYKEAQNKLLEMTINILVTNRTVIVDDIMNLPSIRKKYIRKCSQLKIPFTLLFINHHLTDNTKLKSILSNRNSFIQQEKLIQLVNTFEPPNEKELLFTVIVNPFDYDLKLILKECKLKGELFLQQVMVENKINELKLEQRAGLKSNRLHQLNIQLCKRINLLMKDYTSGNLIELPECLNELRKRNIDSAIVASHLAKVKSLYLKSGEDTNFDSFLENYLNKTFE